MPMQASTMRAGPASDILERSLSCTPGSRLGVSPLPLHTRGVSHTCMDQASSFGFWGPPTHRSDGALLCW